MKANVANLLVAATTALVLVMFRGLRTTHVVRTPSETIQPLRVVAADAETRRDGKISAADRAWSENHSETIRQTIAPATGYVPTDETEVILTNFNARVMADTEMEDFVRDRLWLVLDRLNSPLVQDLNLTPTERAAFKTILVNQMVKAADQAALKISEGIPAAEAVLNDALAQGGDDVDQKLHQLLGDIRYGQYATYRDDFSRYNRIKYLADTPPLTDDQAQQVIATIVAERQIVTAAAREVETPADRTSPEDQNEQIQAVINRQVYEKVKGYLSSDQLAAFSALQAQSLSMMPH